MKTLAIALYALLLASCTTVHVITPASEPVVQTTTQKDCVREFRLPEHTDEATPPAVAPEVLNDPDVRTAFLLTYIERLREYNKNRDDAWMLSYLTYRDGCPR